MTTILSVITIFFSVIVITARNPVVAVVFLISTFTFAALYLINLGVSYIGLSYLIVYVGAIAVLFLFVIIILNVRISEIVSVGPEWSKNLPLGGIIVVLFIYQFISVNADNLFSKINQMLVTFKPDFTEMSISYIKSNNSIWEYNNVQTLGENLYGDIALWLIITSIILLLAIIGPITLCINDKQN